MLVVMAGAGIKGIGVRDVGSRVTRVSGQGSWVQGWVGGPPKGLLSAAAFRPSEAFEAASCL